MIWIKPEYSTDPKVILFHIPLPFPLPCLLRSRIPPPLSLPPGSKRMLTTPWRQRRDQASGAADNQLALSGDSRNLLFVANPLRCDHHIVYSLWISTALAALHKYFISCNISFPSVGKENLQPPSFLFFICLLCHIYWKPHKEIREKTV